jgi:hypothetical protein
MGGIEISNFKSSNTLRNSVLAYPFGKDKRFRYPERSPCFVKIDDDFLQESIEKKDYVKIYFYLS